MIGPCFPVDESEIELPALDFFEILAGYFQKPEMARRWGKLGWERTDIIYTSDSATFFLPHMYTIVPDLGTWE